MPLLSEILEHLYIGTDGVGDGEVTSIGFDSRRSSEGELFFAVRGTASDGHRYMNNAAAAGVMAIICEEIPDDYTGCAPCFTVADSSQALASAASFFYGEPSLQLSLTGVTGTNGKTTVATLLSELFTQLGYRTGLISTVEIRIGEQRIPATHTTPDPVELNRVLAQMVAAGCDYCFMEVSSHSVVQNRIAGLEFSGGIFTNLTRDHLDYHLTFANYIAAKKSFFDRLRAPAFALINCDDRNGTIMLQNTRARTYGYSLRSRADFRCRVIEMHLDGMLLSIDGNEVWVNLTGRFNAYNILAVYAGALLLGEAVEDVLVALSTLKSVAGRFETISSVAGVTAVVDYSHTPDALQNILETLQQMRLPDSRIITVVGCGGDRDPGKRPEMGKIAARESDLAIYTSDNPRSEEPLSIISQIAAGAEAGRDFLEIADRRAAIKTALMTARPGDIVLVAGKGHETYQEIAGVRHHFDDREEIRKIFEKK